MAARHLPLFALVAFLWGIPYLLIAVALTGFDAPFAAWTRVALAAVVLAAVVGPRSLARSLARSLCGRLPAVCGLAVVQFGVPFALIGRVGAARAALVTYASPVVAVALGVVLLHEQPGPLAPLGLALILAGSWLASRAGSGAHVEPAPPRRSRTGQAQRAAAS
jgi:drug/metabolite transporter (DMT)-like permease